ncbi:Protein of unknown function DUF3987) [uncultured Caudovirales phage]|uniref:DNA primase/polymerase bifunctional N-terminal domain-containing protein n=1 Tax=uncultured Caudovirales phage TaxID=2100421 RepID=A0A6J5L548_9CAUD|nr:Protein of unknown function DUF3987) [uncultured Caudovirales phage]CAB4134086.1 Protein of unknown function DUF3987) [uncultured Caudovirales phage]
MEENKALRFLEFFSIITIGENKVPNFQWKEQQTTKLSTEKLLSRLKYNGGLTRTDGTEIPKTNGIGIVTGFDFLEVIDVDTKVFSTQQEKDDFWDEYYNTLKDNILDFEDKFSVYQTKTGGFHILYKSKRIQGNTKIASLKNHKEAVIESRGNGGYVFVYPEKKYAKKSYFEIDFISDNDREILWQISKSYNAIIDKVELPKKESKIYDINDITSWDDFNNKTDIWDIINDEFTIPSRGNKSKHILVKRHNSESSHSGYIFKDSNCLYLFSTGTIYPSEKLISSFSAYAYKYHNGDFKEASKDLYGQGFGSRLKRKIEELKHDLPKDKVKLENAVFPIDIFPEDIQYYINECATKLDSNIDFMGVSLIWLISVCVGNSFEIEVKKGWNENGVVWIAVVGKAGLGKTPSINNIIFPLMKSNSKEIKKFIQESEKYDFYQSLNKKEKEEYPEVNRPKKTQFIANDITLEALVDLHQESDNAVGVFKDELAGWLKDMNKYRAGSDLEFWLSCWSGKSVSMNRKTAKSSFVEKPFIPVLGGIQPTIFNSFSTEENKDNGFMDRMLLAFPDAIVDKYNDSELDYNTIKWYNESMIKMYETFKNSVKRTDNGEINPNLCKFSLDAKNEWKRIFNEITEHQNDENENEYLKSMYPKQKSYIPRFSLLINCLDSFFDESINILEVSKDSVLKAEKLSKYFISVAKKVKYESNEFIELKTTSKKAESTFEKIKLIYQNDKDFNKSKVAELLGVSRMTIIRTIKKIEENEA